MTVELGLTCLEGGRLGPLRGKTEVREEKRGRLNPELALLYRLQGRLKCHSESSFDALAKGRLRIREEPSPFLSWSLKLAFSAWCFGHCEGPVGAKVNFLHCILSKGSLTSWSWKYHHCRSGWTGMGRQVRMLRTVAQPRVLGR